MFEIIFARKAKDLVQQLPAPVNHEKRSFSKIPKWLLKCCWCCCCSYI